MFKFPMREVTLGISDSIWSEAGLTSRAKMWQIFVMVQWLLALSFAGLIGEFPAVVSDLSGGGNGGLGVVGKRATLPQAFTHATVVRRRTFCDSSWEVADLTAPTSEHPPWERRLNGHSNARTDADVASSEAAVE